MLRLNRSSLRNTVLLLLAVFIVSGCERPTREDLQAAVVKRLGDVNSIIESRTPPPSGTTDFDDLSVGDCATLPEGFGFSSAPGVFLTDCGSPHTLEVFAVAPVYSTSYDPVALERAAFLTCSEARVDEYLGTSSVQVLFAAVKPREHSARGEHQVVCVIVESLPREGSRAENPYNQDLDPVVISDGLTVR